MISLFWLYLICSDWFCSARSWRPNILYRDVSSFSPRFLLIYSFLAVGKFISWSVSRIFFWQATIIDTMILIDDEKVCNNCILDDKALDRSKSVWISKSYIVVLNQAEESYSDCLSLHSRRYVQYGYLWIDRAVDIACSRRIEFLKRYSAWKLFLTRQKDRDWKKYLLFFTISFPTFSCRLFESM